MPEEICPLCGRASEQLRSDADATLLSLIQANAPGWRAEDGLCQACLDLFRGARDRFHANPDIFRDGEYRILPTPLRVGADERFSGRGVTIAFLDAGFYPHPDLIEPRNRILHYLNVTDPNHSREEFHSPNDSSFVERSGHRKRVAASPRHDRGSSPRGHWPRVGMRLKRTWVLDSRASANIFRLNPTALFTTGFDPLLQAKPVETC